MAAAGAHDEVTTSVVHGCQRDDDGTIRLRLVGELDLSTADELITTVTSLLAPHPPVLVVDASGVTFIDSTGIGALLATRRECRIADCGFTVVASPSVEKVTRLLGVHDVLTNGGELPDPTSRPMLTPRLIAAESRSERSERSGRSGRSGDEALSDPDASA